ncbi:hypothetical protein [Vibrio atypicus]|uniref:hypothetical protein n=1 Tax=Vibrio atypicus TaxID=558271 RepID=UPI00135825DE|nr:hypothetical protein [Vibrio atypicus]
MVSTFLALFLAFTMQGIYVYKNNSQIGMSKATFFAYALVVTICVAALSTGIEKEILFGTSVFFLLSFTPLKKMIRSREEFFFSFMVFVTVTALMISYVNKYNLW